MYQAFSYWTRIVVSILCIVGSFPAYGETAQLAPLGSPRILVAHEPTLSRLRLLLDNQSESAMRFKDMVDAQIAGTDDFYAFEPWFSALLGQVTNNRRYCTYAVTQTEKFVTSEESLIKQDKRATVAGDSYLYVGPLVGNLSLVYDWCRSSMTASQRQRWQTYANQAVWNVWHPDEAKWGQATYPWSGWSINNPSNNYYYSFLEATMLLGLATHGENLHAQSWLEQFRTTKLEAELFPTFNRDLVGGGSREGTGYGVAMMGLWRLYDWWEKSTGERLADKTTHTQLSLAHLMHNIVPALDRLAPTGDHARDSAALLFDYHRDYLQMLMWLYPNDRLSGMAKTLLAQSSIPQMQNAFMLYSDYLYDHEGIGGEPLSGFNTAYWGQGTGQFMMRSHWGKQAVYASFICGPYTENHAHQDQGSFTLFKNKWLAYDTNITSHSGIRQEPEFHNLVRIEGTSGVIPQRTKEAGGKACVMKALANTPAYAYASANITPVYAGQSQVGKLEREFVFIKPHVFVVFDRVKTNGSNLSKVWTLNTPQKPVVNGSRFTVTQGSQSLDVIRIAPAGLQTKIVSWGTLKDLYGEAALGGYRVDVIDKSVADSNFLHVMDTGKAVLSAVRADAAGQLGVLLSLRDGSRVTVRFNTHARGGQLRIQKPDGSVVTDRALPNTIATPSLFVGG